MLTNSEVKYIQSLSQKKFREKEKLFVVEGVKMAQEVLESNFNVHSIYATKEWALNKTELDVNVIDEAQLKRISSLNTPNEVLIVVKQKTEPEKFQFKNNITLLLDGIQDPGNFGTIIRTVDWFGVNQIIASTDSVELYNSKVIQATMGSLFRVNVQYKNLPEIMNAENLPVYGALLEGKSVYEMSKITEGFLIVGNESKGIRESVISKITHPITIPRKGKAESLNVAMATGIILSHLYK